MDIVVIVALGVLLVIFIGSLVALIVICRQRTRMDLERRPMLKYSRQHLDHLLTAADGDDVALTELGPHIAKLIHDNDYWIFDPVDNFQQCLKILRLAQTIINKLATILDDNNKLHNKELLEQVSTATQRIMPRVDDLIRSMYMCTSAARNVHPGAGGAGQQHAVLLDARASALIVTCASLVAIVRTAAATTGGTPGAVHMTSADRKVLAVALADMDACAIELRAAADLEEQCERVDILIATVPEESDELVDRGERAPSDECPADPAVSTTTTTDEAVVVDANEHRS